ncbi:MAG TPA: acyl--CoA ligase [Bryobacteraceae bacterium]|nr:acyl--CoA ligase [Bryobacteraceae bacterium]
MREPRTLLDVLDAADGQWTAVTLPDTGSSVTYDELRRRVRGMAGALYAAGVQRGDRVAMALPNGLDAIVSFLAAAAAGTAAPLNPGYKFEEFCFYLADTRAKLLMVPRPDGAEGAEARRAAEQAGIPVVTPEISDGVRTPDPGPDDTALVLHTSGSTGRPKRVPLLHRNLVASVRNIAETYALGPADVSLCLMPLFHVHGLMASTMATLLTGGTVVVPSRFNALTFWRMVRDYGVTWYSAAPTMHQLILTRKRSGDEKLRFVRSCSAALAPDLMRRMEEYFATPVLEAYGMTEASHQMASNPLPPAARKAGSVGPGTGVCISIRDDRGGELPCGKAGEVCIDGPGVIRAYENNPEATAQSFFGEWFRTGDQGILDADGYLQLTGRLKELIIRAGENIAPREIDEVLLAHPAVAEAVCFGVPHPTWGEEVEAAVVLYPETAVGESDLIHFCRGRLADFKCPKKIRIVASIPRTATGKIQRLNVAATLAGVSK